MVITKPSCSEYFKNLGLISTSSEKVLYDFVNKNYKVRKQKKVFDKSFDPIKKIANKLIELNK